MTREYEGAVASGSFWLWLSVMLAFVAIVIAVVIHKIIKSRGGRVRKWKGGD